MSNNLLNRIDNDSVKNIKNLDPIYVEEFKFTLSVIEKVTVLALNARISGTDVKLDNFEEHAVYLLVSKVKNDVVIESEEFLTGASINSGMKAANYLRRTPCDICDIKVLLEGYNLPAAAEFTAKKLAGIRGHLRHTNRMLFNASCHEGAIDITSEKVISLKELEAAKREVASSKR